MTQTEIAPETSAPVRDTSTRPRRSASRWWLGVVAVMAAVGLVTWLLPRESGSSSRSIFTNSTVSISLNDYRVALPAQTLSAGAKTLRITDHGTTQHELLVFRPDASLDPAKLPLGTDGDLNEDAAGVDKISDGDNIDPGGSQDRQLDLSQPGTYVFLCNLPGHYQLGMWTTVTVR